MPDQPASPPTGPPRILITAGPTHEPIDEVRYLANRSSGRMGIALAEAAARRGHPTTLLLGPTHLVPDVHPSLEVRRFRTTSDLQRSLEALWPRHDLLIMAAAVADYRPPEGECRLGKLRRSGEPLVLELEPTPDLVGSLERRGDQRIVGFALEPADRLETAAHEKLDRKHLDAIVANPLDTMDAERVSAVLIRSGADDEPAPPGLTKPAFAEWLLDRVI